MEQTDSTSDTKPDTKTGVRGAKKFDISPFIESMTVTTKTKRLTVAQGSTIVDLKTGEIEGTTQVVQMIEVESDEFIKLFTRDLAIWFDLSRAGMRVFGITLQVVQQSAIGRDLVFIDHKNPAMKEFGLSKNMFYRGLDELISKKFLARHVSGGWYYINPAMFFNGNRARFIKEYRRTVSTVSDETVKKFRTQINALEAAGQQRLELNSDV